MKSYAILGDSYSTYEGYVPKDYNYWYSSSGNECSNDMPSVEASWWYLIEKKYKLKRLANCSFSGSAVSYSGYKELDGVKTSFIYRMKRELGEKRTDALSPDLIFIFGGTNDSWLEVPAGNCIFENWNEEDLKSFAAAFCYMLDYLKKWNPSSRIINLVNDEITSDIRIRMQEACDYYGIENLELSSITKENGHPNKEGMRQIAKQISEYLDILAYNYRNLPIPGGGYVTGFTYHKKITDRLYLRTDIGGVYKYQSDKKCWKALFDHVSQLDISETFPAAIALGLHNPDELYVMSGTDNLRNGKISISKDSGLHFDTYKLPFMVHGNLNGRGTGSRLIVDEINDNRLYYASQEDGLWRSFDKGKNWEKIESMPEDYLTFVCQLKDGKALVVGSAGVKTKRSSNLRGEPLYVSYDDGKSFEILGHPADGEVKGIKLAGLVAQRYCYDEKYLYVTFSVMGYNAYVLENGYSCDGGSLVGGKVVRYSIDSEGKISSFKDISPIGDTINYLDENKLLKFGYGGISIAENSPGLLVVSTLCKEDDDCIFRSFDYGNSWECILSGLSIGRMNFRTEYMKPQYNGGRNIIHWLSDLKINPFNKNEMWFNSGTGVFKTENLTADTVIFQDWSDGIEETVHLNLYSPAAGDVKLIDILGDLGGFAFENLDRPCDNSFADNKGNRYITCLNADYSDKYPETVIVTARGNWTGKTKGGLILSKDQCKSFKRLDMPFGISDRIDELLKNIERPNVNSGWAALSLDTKHIVWSIADMNELPINSILVSHNKGKTFKQVKIYDLNKQLLTASSDKKTNLGTNLETNAEIDAEKPIPNMKVFSDRKDSSIFYGFGDNGRFYISRDYADNFYEQKMPDEFPKINMGLVDCANKTEIRGENGKSGIFYLALGKEGLWKLIYNKENEKILVKKLSSKGDFVFRLGLGLISPDSEYLNDNKALYISGIIKGEYGFFRSFDDGESYERLNNNKQMFGDINSVEGDSRVFGRFYIGTGSRGVLYAEPIRQN